MPGTTVKGVPYSIGSDPAASIDTTMQKLAEWVDGRPGIAPMTTTQRDALAGADLWDGRVILNTTKIVLERYNLATTAWVSVFKSATVFRDTHNFTLQGDVRVDNVAQDFYINPYFIDLPVGQSNTVVRIRHVLRLGGTATCSFQRRKTDGTVTTLASFTVGTTDGVLTTGLPVLLTDGDRLSLVVTATTGTPKHLTVGVAHELAV